MNKIHISIIILMATTSQVKGANPIRPAPWVGTSLDGKTTCTYDMQPYGPHDYTQRALIDPYRLTVVEKRHFTPTVENLVGGETSSTPDGDLLYTLNAWPNHPRALLSMIRYQLKIRDKLVKDKLTLPPECYLQRAINFSPADYISYSLFGYYLHKVGYPEKAVKSYEKALELSNNNAKIAYSFSLLLIDLKRYDEASAYAKIAYQKPGAPLGLKQKLQKLGVWKDK